MEELIISDEYYNNFEYGATFDCRMINWRKGESSLQKREMFQSGDRCTAAVCWPQCQYSSVRGVHVLGPGPRHVCDSPPLDWLAPAGGWWQLPQTSDHTHTAVADWCRPTHTFSSCSRSRSCHVRPNLTRVPSCFVECNVYEI